MHLINRKQNGVTITIGPFGNIDRELFKIVSHYHFNGLQCLLILILFHILFSDYK